MPFSHQRYRTGNALTGQLVKGGSRKDERGTPLLVGNRLHESSQNMSPATGQLRAVEARLNVAVRLAH
jgi:hypothetical protein